MPVLLTVAIYRGLGEEEGGGLAYDTLHSSAL